MTRTGWPYKTKNNIRKNILNGQTCNKGLSNFRFTMFTRKINKSLKNKNYTKLFLYSKKVKSWKHVSVHCLDVLSEFNCCSWDSCLISLQSHKNMFSLPCCHLLCWFLTDYLLFFIDKLRIYYNLKRFFKCVYFILILRYEKVV